MPTLARPDVDVLDGLTTAIVVDQERMGADARSTVGTTTDANAMLRILFSRLGQPHIGSPSAFAFNVASVEVEGINLTYAGLIPQIQKSFLFKDVGALQPHVRAFVQRLKPPPRRRRAAARSPRPARRLR